MVVVDEVWPPGRGELIAVVPPDWEITDPAAPRCRAEVVDVVGDLVTVRVLGQLRLRRLYQVAPWVDEERQEGVR